MISLQTYYLWVICIWVLSQFNESVTISQYLIPSVKTIK